MEAVFNWKTENLSIKVTVNDDDYGNDRLGLFFDRNHDGVLAWNSTPTEYGYCLGYWNSSHKYAQIAKTGAVITPKCAPDYPSPYHTCTYKENVGYTFNVSIPKKEINFETSMLVHICFYEESFIYMMPVFVWKQFKVQ